MSWLDRFCDDYRTNKNRVSQKAKINSSTLSSIKSKSIKNTKAEIVHKTAKMVDASMDDMYRWYK